MPLQKYIDLTNLKATATYEDIEKLCSLAKKNNFFSVCVNPCRVIAACELLGDSDVKVCTVIGFPLGASSIEAKVAEANAAKAQGADELDMVVNIGKLLDGDYNYILDEINAIADVGLVTKVIIETCYLTEADIAVVSRIVACSKAHFIKTSTGFGTAGATVENIALMRRNVGDRIGVKAAGGVRDMATAMAMFKAGADRVGTSSVFEELIDCPNETRESIMASCGELLQRNKSLKCVCELNTLPLRLF